MSEPTKTIIRDVIVPEVFNPYVIQRTAELSAFYQSGIIARTPELDRLASSGGKLINMPFWEDLTGEDEVLSDQTALTVGKITAKQDVAALLARGRAWSVNDLAKALSGDDPMAAIGDLVAEYWARRFQAILIKTLEGIFSHATNGVNYTAGMDTNKHDISAETGEAAVIDAKTAVDAIYKLGDNADKLTGFAMHSATVAKLTKDDLIETIPPSEGKPAVRTFLGKPVVVDDGLPVEDGVYTTYIFGAGAFGWGEGGAPVPVETARDALAGDDILIHRRHFILHPRGVAFQNAYVAGATPSNDELANPRNWKRVYEPKNVRIVQFKHRLAAVASQG